MKELVICQQVLTRFRIERWRKHFPTFDHSQVSVWRLTKEVRILLKFIFNPTTTRRTARSECLNAPMQRATFLLLVLLLASLSLIKAERKLFCYSYQNTTASWVKCGYESSEQPGNVSSIFTSQANIESFLNFGASILL